MKENDDNNDDKENDDEEDFKDIKKVPAILKEILTIMSKDKINNDDIEEILDLLEEAKDGL